MSSFTLTIELGNDAMRNGSDLAHALHEVAGRLDGTMAVDLPGTEGRIRDENGNTVGRWEVRDDG